MPVGRLRMRGQDANDDWENNDRVEDFHDVMRTVGANGCHSG